MRKREQEFKALLNIAPFNERTVKKICGSLDKALVKHPEWKKHIEDYRMEKELEEVEEIIRR